MRIRRAIDVCAAMLCVIALAGCHVSRPNADHAREQVSYEALGSEPRTFNPILVTDFTSVKVVDNIFESLVRINPKSLLPEGGIASSWEVSPDNRTVTFHLRKDVKWFDGQPLTSKDVLFTIKVILDARIPNSIRYGLLVDGKPISANAPDDYTVVFSLPKPFAPLFYSIGIPVIPEHLLNGPYEKGTFNRTWGINTPVTQVIGDGAYRMARYVPAQSIQFRQNPQYWMKDEQGAPLPRLHGRSYLIVPDQNVEFLRFLAGQVDIYTPRPQEVMDLMEDAPKLGIEIRKIGIDPGSMFFCFNRNPRHYIRKGVTDPKLKWFTDLNFLKAIAHSIDKQGIIDLAYHGLAIPAVAEISPENKIFHNPNLRDYNYDLAEAQRLLEAGGYHLVAPGVRVDALGNRLEFNLMTNTGVAVREQTCAILKQDLESLGIKVNYRPLDFTTMVDKLDSTFDWDCVLIGFTGTVDPNDGSNVYRSSGNLHLWNPNQETPATPWEAEIDRLLDEGASEMDISKRPQYYWRLQEILHDQLPIIETVRQVEYMAWKKSLMDFQPTVWGMYKPEWISFRPE